MYESGEASNQNWASAHSEHLPRPTALSKCRSHSASAPCASGLKTSDISTHVPARMCSVLLGRCGSEYRKAIVWFVSCDMNLDCGPDSAWRSQCGGLLPTFPHITAYCENRRKCGAKEERLLMLSLAIWGVWTLRYTTSTRLSNESAVCFELGKYVS